MNLAFLGDALDHWKGSIFESLQQARVVRDFAVDAMASDRDDWRQEDSTLFAKLLRVEPGKLIPHKQSLADRKSYFEEIKHKGDLFLDPDTGIATGRVSKKHLAPSEVAALLESGDRLLAVYQHVRAIKVCDRVDAVCRVIQRASPRAHWCSYESGTVAMIFFATAPGRVDDVRGHFTSLLGRHAEGRIRRSTREV